MDIEEFTRMAGRLLEEIPEPLLEGLNGGISVAAEAKRAGKGPAGTYVMGEYHVEEPGLGRLIVIYHGSFLKILGRAPREEWIRELRATIRHELRHHREALAGSDELAREDEEIWGE